MTVSHARTVWSIDDLARLQIARHAKSKDSAHKRLGIAASPSDAATVGLRNPGAAAYRTARACPDSLIGCAVNRDIRSERRHVAILYPFPDIAGHVMQPKSVGSKRSHRSDAGKTIMTFYMQPADRRLEPIQIIQIARDAGSIGIVTPIIGRATAGARCNSYSASLGSR